MLLFICVYYSVAQGGQKRTLDPLELKLQVVESASDMGAGNWTVGPQKEQQVCLTAEPSFSAPILRFLSFFLILGYFSEKLKSVLL